MAGRRVGVFGGTFDPPHVGHLVAAIEVREALGLDVVLMVVANTPWQKVGTRPISAAVDRLAMVEAAVAGVDGIEVSDIEIRRGGPTYTVDTLEQLRAEDPDAELLVVLGADAAAGLDTWERPADVADLCRIVVVDRPGSTAAVPDGFAVDRVAVPRLDISSTQMRERAAAGRSLRFLLPDGVISVVLERRLYGDRP